MCVIAYCEKKIPTQEQLNQMETQNSAGAGVAWFEAGRVKWEKGISAKRVGELLGVIPLPCVIHFRLATVGGQTRKLCHPFPISEDSPLFKCGVADSVLFHNGHCNHWEEYLMASGLKLKGDVSDSRAIAAITAHNQNLQWLYRISGIYAVMLAEKQTVLRVGYYTEQDGVWYSNLYWERKPYVYEGKSRDYSYPGNGAREYLGSFQGRRHDGLGI